MSRHLIGLVPFALLAVAAGCSPDMVPATARPALSANAVEIFVKAPKKFEDHGFVFVEVAPSTNDFQADVYVDQLKETAASKGADGLLIAPIDEWKESKGHDSRYVYVGGFYKGKFYNFPVTTEKPRRMVGRAIYVIDR